MNTPLVTARSLVHLLLRAQWQEGDSHHTAIHHFDKFNVWRDIDLLPLPLQREVLNQPLGHQASHRFSGSALVEPWQARAIKQAHPRQLHITTRCGTPVEPAWGRFYPQGMVEGIEGIFKGNMHPMRLVELGAERIALDFNHPLALSELDLGVELLALQPAGDEHGGRCTESLAELLAGPGMQMRYQGEATDFFSGNPFHRLDEAPDGLFYTQPRLVQHLDRGTLEQVSRLYGELLTGRRRVLDLMASWDSHLPAELELDELIGLGMNTEELAANPRLSRRLVQDLNREPRLPFPDASLDAVICTVSVEYLTQPLALFREVARVLVPGGIFVNSFSNRWFPTKAIALWSDLHEFERLGLVSEYYRQAGDFERIHTYSLRGLPRPADDPHIGLSPWADPLYAVWGFKG